MKENIDYAVQQFIIDQTNGDETVELYEQWCDVSDAMQYDHYNANNMLLSMLEYKEPIDVLDSIMNGFVMAANMYTASTGIYLNPQASSYQVLMFVQTMTQLATQEDYSFINETLYGDLPERDKIQIIFEHIGPGQDPQYENLIDSVQSTTIESMKAIIKEITSTPQYEELNRSMIDSKLKLYSRLKESVDGDLFSDRFALYTQCFNMDIDYYITSMKENIDFYLDEENYDDFFIDVWGCIILSNTKREDYIKTLEAAVHEFYSDDVSVSKALSVMKEIIKRLPS